MRQIKFFWGLKKGVSGVGQNVNVDKFYMLFLSPKLMVLKWS